jgi:hypothetical protein
MVDRVSVPHPRETAAHYKGALWKGFPVFQDINRYKTDEYTDYLSGNSYLYIQTHLRMSKMQALRDLFGKWRQEYNIPVTDFYTDGIINEPLTTQTKKARNCW